MLIKLCAISQFYELYNLRNTNEKVRIINREWLIQMANSGEIAGGEIKYRANKSPNDELQPTMFTTSQS